MTPTNVFFFLIIPEVTYKAMKMRWNFIGERFFFLLFLCWKHLCVSSLFSDKISAGWIKEVHAVWLHMDESKVFASTEWFDHLWWDFYYFETNSIKDANRKTSVLHSVCGTEIFSLLKDLITPDSLRDKTLDKPSQAFEEHCNPAPSVIVTGFNFCMYWQQPN